MEIHEQGACLVTERRETMDEAPITIQRETIQINGLSEAIRALSFTSRHAVTLGAEIGSYYHLNTDEILSMYIMLPKSTIESHNLIACEILTPPAKAPVNLLKLINIDPAQRLSIASGIQPAQQIAALHNYTQAVDQYTRILHYSSITGSDQLADAEFTSLMRKKPRLGRSIGTHIIARINFGIEAVVILQLPTNDQLVAKIDRSLERICRYFREDRLPMWRKEELEELNTIRFTDIFANTPSLVSIKSIIELQREIHLLIPRTKYHFPCTYDLCPIEHLFSIKKQVLIGYNEVSVIASELIEQHLLELASDFDDMEWFINENYPNCDKHPAYSPDAIAQEWTALKQIHSDEIKRIQKWVKDVRTGALDPTRSTPVISDNQVQPLKRRIREFIEKLIARAKKERLIANIVAQGFECEYAAKYEIAEQDDDRGLQKKLKITSDNLRIVCGTDQLHRDQPGDWKKICSQLRDEVGRNDQLKVHYVDFTNHPYKLQRFKIFPMKEEAQPPPPVKPSPLATQDDDEIINVLLLGESGVGKSTFINALVNYLRYENFEAAEKNKPVILLPVAFLVTTGENFDEVQVEYDGLDTGSYEDHDHPGQSVTQHCRSYIFTIKEDQRRSRKVRLIDTPGFSDSRGIEQDQKNMQEILWFINNLSHLHAICILVRPNITRLHISFRSCSSQLFDLVGTHARDNLLFCFTNVSSTFHA